MIISFEKHRFLFVVSLCIAVVVGAIAGKMIGLWSVGSAIGYFILYGFSYVFHPDVHYENEVDGRRFFEVMLMIANVLSCTCVLALYIDFGIVWLSILSGFVLYFIGQVVLGSWIVLTADEEREVEKMIEK